MTIEIFPMSSNDISEATKVLTLAFENMPSTLSVYKYAKNINQKQEVLFKALISQKAGQVYLAKE